MKDSSGDLANMQAMIARFPGFAVLAGADPLLLPLLKEAARAASPRPPTWLPADLAFVFRNHADPAQEERSAGGTSPHRRGAEPRLALRPDRLDQDACSRARPATPTGATSARRCSR